MGMLFKKLIGSPLVKLIGSPLVKKSPTLYGTRSFVEVGNRYLFAV
jgi:hypothetical protein